MAHDHFDAAVAILADKQQGLCDRRDPALNEVRLFLNDFRRGEHGAKRYVLENITDIDQPFESLFEELAIRWRSQESSRSSPLHQGGGFGLIAGNIEILGEIGGDPGLRQQSD